MLQWQVSCGHHAVSGPEKIFGSRGLRADPTPVQTTANQGHGWVVPRKDGHKARCGGPNICSLCRKEREALLSKVIDYTTGTPPKTEDK